MRTMRLPVNSTALLHANMTWSLLLSEVGHSPITIGEDRYHVVPPSIEHWNPKSSPSGLTGWNPSTWTSLAPGELTENVQRCSRKLNRVFPGPPLRISVIASYWLSLDAVLV